MFSGSTSLVLVSLICIGKSIKLVRLSKTLGIIIKKKMLYVGNFRVIVWLSELSNSIPADGRIEISKKIY